MTKRLLIVDDEATSRMMISKFLEKYGECDFAMDGMEAIRKVHKSIEDNKPYSLITLDILMPNILGSKALSIIRNMEKENNVEKPTKIIFITSLDEDKIEIDLNPEFEAYLGKPLIATKLFAILDCFDIKHSAVEES